MCVYLMDPGSIFSGYFQSNKLIVSVISQAIKGMPLIYVK